MRPKALVVALAALSLAVPAAADAAAPTQKTLETYSGVWHACKRSAACDAPRNVRARGVRFKWVSKDQTRRHWGTRPATAAEISGGVRAIRRDLAATRPIPNYGSSNPMVNPWCESRGNPQVVSPNGMYWGKYQFDKRTWEHHGGAPGAYGNASEAEQDRVAARVRYDAWPNC